MDLIVYLVPQTKHIHNRGANNLPVCMQQNS